MPTPPDLSSEVFPLLATKLRARIEVGKPDACWDWTGAHFTRSSGRSYGRVCLPVLEFGRTAPAGAFWRGATREIAVSRAIIILRMGRELDSKLEHALHSCDHPPCCNPGHLRLAGPLENAGDRLQRNRGSWSCGEDHGRAKLTWAAVREIRAEYAAGGVFQRVLAAKHGVHQTVIGQIIRRKIWRDEKRAPLAFAGGTR